MRRRDLTLLLGAAALAPSHGLRAQAKATPTVGFLHFGLSREFAYQVPLFRRGLAQQGYVEGRNVAIEPRWAEGHYDRLPALAADLVARKVDVIFASGPPSVMAAKSATASIPIVFIYGADPVRDGLAKSLAHPGGNLTGLSILISDLMPKRLELMLDLLPQSKLFAVLVNPDDANLWLAEVEAAARGKNLRLAMVEARNEAELDAAFARLATLQADALVLGSAAFFTARREQLGALAARHRIPAIGQWREFTAAGGLMSYGLDVSDIFQQAGIYAARILGGEKPADLPIIQPTKFELVINLKAAKALGLAVPPPLLAQADDAIE